jgi:hypothetical protein
MRRGDRPDFTLLRQPQNAYTTRAQQWMLDQLLDLEPGSEDVDGGGYASKRGYHNTVAGNDALAGVGEDYSARDPEDRRGPHDKTRGRDWTFRDAQAGPFRDLAEYGDLQLAAYRANDPRLAGWREYLGRVSTPVTIGGTSTRRVGIDFRHRRLRIPDDSHDWHGHFSEDTEQVESFQNKWALLTVLAGWTVAEWRQSTVEDDMSADDVKAIRGDIARLGQFLSLKPNALFNPGAKDTAWVGEAVTLPQLGAQMRLQFDAVLAAVASDGDAAAIRAHIDQRAAEMIAAQQALRAQLAADVAGWAPQLVVAVSEQIAGVDEQLLTDALAGALVQLAERAAGVPPQG